MLPCPSSKRSDAIAAGRRGRLDAELVRRGLCESRTAAQEAIAAGLVLVDGAPAGKSAAQVSPGQAVSLTAPPRRYVSRGGHKLAHALDRFGVDPSGRHVLDAGISTGGFTDCLLQRGAAHVLGVDVGYGQVHERLRQDGRVTVRERTNIRDLTPADLPAPAPDLLVADLSFIGLSVVLATLVALVRPGGELVLLVKPQFEAQKSDIAKGGVVRDSEVWRRVLHEVVAGADDVGWPVVGLAASPLTGPAGNVEFLAHLTDHGDPVDVAQIDSAVQEGLDVRAATGAVGDDGS